MAAFLSRLNSFSILSIVLRLKPIENDLGYFFANSVVERLWTTKAPSLNALEETLLIYCLHKYFKKLPLSYLQKLTVNELAPGGPYFSSDWITNVFIFNTLLQYGIRIEKLEDWIIELGSANTPLYDKVLHQVVYNNINLTDDDCSALIASLNLDLTIHLKYDTKCREIPIETVQKISEELFKQETKHFESNLQEDFRRLTEGKLLEEIIRVYIYVLRKEWKYKGQMEFIKLWGAYIFWGVICSSAIDYIVDEDSIHIERSGLEKISDISYRKLIATKLIPLDVLESARLCHINAKLHTSQEHLSVINLPIYYPLLNYSKEKEKSEGILDKYFLSKKICDDISDLNIDGKDVVSEMKKLKDTAEILQGLLSDIEEYFWGFEGFQEMLFICKYCRHETSILTSYESK